MRVQDEAGEKENDLHLKFDTMKNENKKTTKKT